MNHPLRSAALAAAAAIGLAVAPATAIAAPASQQAPAAVSQAAPDSYHNSISMRQQEKNMWCWSATGSTLAAFHGVSISQTRFCQYVYGGSGSACPNNGAWLHQIQPVYRQLGFRSSGHLRNSMSYDEVQRELSSGRPIPTDIHWRSGGGHIQLLYGYDRTRNLIYWGDPARAPSGTTGRRTSTTGATAASPGRSPWWASTGRHR